MPIILREALHGAPTHMAGGQKAHAATDYVAEQRVKTPPVSPKSAPDAAFSGTPLNGATIVAAAFAATYASGAQGPDCSTSARSRSPPPSTPTSIGKPTARTTIARSLAAAHSAECPTTLNPPSIRDQVVLSRTTRCSRLQNSHRAPIVVELILRLICTSRIHERKVRGNEASFADWWAAGSWRGPIVVGLLAGGIGVVGFFVVRALGGTQQLAVLMEQVQTVGLRMRDWIEQSGPWAPLTYLVAKAVTFICLPWAGYPLNVASGALFGLFWGVILTRARDTLGGCILYVLSRWAGRPAGADRG